MDWSDAAAMLISLGIVLGVFYWREYRLVKNIREFSLSPLYIVLLIVAILAVKYLI